MQGTVTSSNVEADHPREKQIWMDVQDEGESQTLFQRVQMRQGSLLWCCKPDLASRKLPTQCQARFTEKPPPRVLSIFTGCSSHPQRCWQNWLEGKYRWVFCSLLPTTCYRNKREKAHENQKNKSLTSSCLQPPPLKIPNMVPGGKGEICVSPASVSQVGQRRI